jgi:dCTP deaminase
VSDNPWDDWTPGVLSKSQARKLCEAGHISGISKLEEAMDHSALDLTLSNECYFMDSGAVKPFGPRYKHLITQQRLAQRLEPRTDGTFLLKERETYLFKLAERLEDLDHSGIHGQATAKSSVGRVDVLARLIVDGMDGYESFSPEKVGNGDLYLEVTPLTFPVSVKEGISLTQLRFFYGSPRDCEIRGREAYKTFIKGSTSDDGTLSVDLTPTDICGHSIVAFRAHNEADREDAAIPLWKGGSHPDPCRFWRFVRCDQNNRLSLQKNLFYILRSKERIALPGGVAVYCRAIDETFGEMRIHYAGFVHPFFGRTRSDNTIGTPLIFEVRGHDVHVSLKDAEKMARLTFYRMSEDAESAANPERKFYENQTLQLSKFFGEWPERVTIDEDGTVTPA